MSSFKEAMLLYFGGYQPDKRLNVDLEEMIIRQNHTPEGAAKLRKIWPKIISEVRKRDTISREVSIESGRELLKQELGRPNPLAIFNHKRRFMERLVFADPIQHIQHRRKRC